MRYVAGAVEGAAQKGVVLVVTIADGGVNGKCRHACRYNKNPATDDRNVRILCGSNGDRTDRMNDSQIPIQTHEHKRIVAGAGQNQN